MGKILTILRGKQSTEPDSRVLSYSLFFHPENEHRFHVSSLG